MLGRPDSHVHQNFKLSSNSLDQASDFLDASQMTQLPHRRPSPQLEASAGHPMQGHSPLKVRHSVDLGVDRSKLLGNEGPTVAHEVGLGALRQDLKLSG